MGDTSGWTDEAGNWHSFMKAPPRTAVVPRLAEIERERRCDHGHGVFVCDTCWDVSELPMNPFLAETVRAIAKVRIHHRGVDVTVGNPRRIDWEDLA